MGNNPLQALLELHKTLTRGQSQTRRYPFPEIVHDGEWSIEPVPQYLSAGKGFVSLEHRTMIVPLGDDPKAARIRAHEMGHAAWTPINALEEIPKGMKEAYVQAAEDMRIHGKLKRVGIDLSQKLWKEWHYRPGGWKEETPAEAVQEMIAYYNTGDAEGARFAMKKREDYKQISKAVERARRRLCKEGASFEDTLAVARELQEEFDPKAPPIKEDEKGKPEDNPKGKQDGGTSGGGGGGGDQEQQEQKPPEKKEPPEKPEDKPKDEEVPEVEEAEPLPKAAPPPEPKYDYDKEEWKQGYEPYEAEQDQQKQTGDADIGNARPNWADGGNMAQVMYGEDVLMERAEHWEEQTDKQRKPDNYIDDEGRWGRMKIVRHPFVKKLPNHIRGKRKRATDEGAIPRQMHRLYVDQQVFQRTVRIATGSVLLDTSGSMSLTLEEVEQMMEMMPAGIVATYRGHHTVGHLNIVAEGGQRVSREHLIPQQEGGNCIDGPALRWLAEQDAPRFWISDGYVVGINETQSREHQFECVAIMRRHQIVRIGDASTLLTMARKFTGQANEENGDFNPFGDAPDPFKNLIE